MFTYDHIVRIATAAVCSLILTTVAIGATLAPVQTGTTALSTYASAGTGESAHG
jgi:hypothetical protein